MPMNFKTQTVEVSVGNAVAANTITPADLPNPDRDYPWVLGVWIKTITNSGGNTYMMAGVDDSTDGEILSVAPSELYYSDSALKSTDKFFPFKRKNDGRIFKAKVKNPVLTTDALGKVVFVFLLSKTEEPVFDKN